MKNGIYGGLIDKAMRAQDMNRRDLAKATDYSYEHIRKIISGLPLMSEDFNEKVCHELGLDAKEMWATAVREKLEGSRRYSAYAATLPPDNRLKDAWAELTAEDQQRVVSAVEGLAEIRRIEREERLADDPAKIRERIIALTNRLGTIRSSDHQPRRRRA